jgi:hypothetical protein
MDKRLVLACCTILLAGCMDVPGDSYGYPPVLAPVGGGAVAPAAPPVQAPAPVHVMPIEIPPEEPGKVEIHGAVSPANCRKMAERFKQEGRKVWLDQIVPNPAGHGSFVLRFLCIFKGKDATPAWYGEQWQDSNPYQQ